MDTGIPDVQTQGSSCLWVSLGLGGAERLKGWDASCLSGDSNRRGQKSGRCGPSLFLKTLAFLAPEPGYREDFILVFQNSFSYSNSLLFNLRFF